MKTTRRTIAAGGLLLAGAVLGACATSQADGLAERLRAAADKVYARLAEVGNEACAARREPLVEILRESAFQTLSARVQENGARWEFQGIKCFEPDDPS